MTTLSTRLYLATLAAAALAMSAVVAHAQTAPHAHPAPAAPAKAAPAKAAAPTASPTAASNAELQKEVDALREEVRQLKKALEGTAAHSAPAPAAKPAAAKKPAMPMGMKDCDGMKAGGMGMKGHDGMAMDKKDGCMKMPPADQAKPDPMGDDMDEMDMGDM
jgi:hypothetical protein